MQILFIKKASNIRDILLSSIEKEVIVVVIE